MSSGTAPLQRPWVSLVALGALAAAVTAGLDVLFLHRVSTGSDNALRLAATLPYVGVDGWYTLARALGITALVFSYGSVATGLALGARGRRNGGTAVAGVHRQLSLLVLVLAAGHAAFPYASVFPPYQGWATATVPFGQPVSWGPAVGWETLGIVAFYLGVVTGPTFYVVGRLRLWPAAHRLAFAVYGLAAAHTVLIGTDFVVRGQARVAFIAAQAPLSLLIGRRLAALAGPGRPYGRRAALVVGTAGAAGMVVLAGLVASGTVAGGLKL